MQKNILITWCTGIALMMGFGGCLKVENFSINTPTAEAITQNPTIGELNNLVTGTESGMRLFIGTYLDAVGAIGREMYRFSGSEPRWTTEILGGASSTLDSNAFYVVNPWGSNYADIKNANLLLEAAANCKLLTDDQRKGYTGWAKTIIAYQMLLNLTMTYDNGIRTDVANFNKLGPIVSKDDALTYIATQLDLGRDDLAAASVIFPLSGGFTTFIDAAGLTKFNRALAARVAVYRQKWADALTDLTASFFDLNGGFNIGVFYAFSAATGDQLNNFYTAQNSFGEIRPAHPSYATDIEAGDDRIGKATLRTSPATQSGLTSNRDVWIVTSNIAPLPLIRNEELILIYAEASAQTNAFANAATALSKIRTGHNLAAYSGAMTQAALITEMLKQRRYSLYCEGHRWVDMRRYNLLSQLPIDRPADDVWTEFPLPALEK
ncbi:MAG TPA: RagB/SusD family nutrient uptake outer membrane protein [Puia sp.]|nr:RagB/SusD family nutrient uptake outer membrane protein [Puia sp.]